MDTEQKTGSTKVNKYAQFVKENFNNVSGSPQERMKKIAEMWKQQ